MTKEEKINWLTNLMQAIGQSRYQGLWHYGPALNEIIGELREENEEE